MLGVGFATFCLFFDGVMKLWSDWAIVRLKTWQLESWSWKNVRMISYNMFEPAFIFEPIKNRLGSLDRILKKCLISSREVHCIVFYWLVIMFKSMYDLDWCGDYCWSYVEYVRSANLHTPLREKTKKMNICLRRKRKNTHKNNWNW